MQFLKQLIGLLLIIAIGYVLYVLATKASGGPRDFSVSADGTATFTGTVLANVTNCFDDTNGDCFLQVKSGNSQVIVMYNTSDTGFCVNEIATNAGKNTKVGDVIKVYGFFKQNETINTVYTCPSATYYIQPF
jgi:hypothetical protein